MNSAQNPFINVTEKGDDFLAENCEFVGDRPTIKTAAKNTRLIRVRHIIPPTKIIQPAKKNIQEHPYLTGIIIVLIGLMIEYTFFV